MDKDMWNGQELYAAIEQLELGMLLPLCQSCSLTWDRIKEKQRRAKPAACGSKAVPCN